MDLKFLHAPCLAHDDTWIDISSHSCVKMLSQSWMLSSPRGRCAYAFLVAVRMNWVVATFYSNLKTALVAEGWYLGVGSMWIYWDFICIYMFLWGLDEFRWDWSIYGDFIWILWGFYIDLWGLIWISWRFYGELVLPFYFYFSEMIGKVSTTATTPCRSQHNTRLQAVELVGVFRSHKRSSCPHTHLLQSGPSSKSLHEILTFPSSFLYHKNCNNILHTAYCNCNENGTVTVSWRSPPVSCMMTVPWPFPPVACILKVLCDVFDGMIHLCSTSGSQGAPRLCNIHLDWKDVDPEVWFVRYMCGVMMTLWNNLTRLPTPTP